MGNEWIQKKLYDISIKDFYLFRGLLSTSAILWIFLLFLWKYIFDKNLLISLIAIGLINLIIILKWFLGRYYYRKRIEKRLGLVVAIKTEDLEQYSLLKNDFFGKFKPKIKDLELPFDVIELNQFQSKKVNTVEDARRVLDKTHSQFCVWGSVKKRNNLPDRQKYIFELRGVVVHKPIKEVQKALLIKEFNRYLPHSLTFEENIQFEGFEFRANQLLVAVDYITGRAALLSGDFNTAIDLHEVLYKQIQEGNIKINNSETDRIKKLLSIEYELKAENEIRIGGKNSVIKDILDKASTYNRESYGLLLKRAIVQFDNGNGDVDKAINTIEQARKSAPKGAFHWLYSKAFLLFWKEEYPEAIKVCNKIKNKSYEGEETTTVEVIDFNIRLLKDFSKPQLYYWIGFVAFIKAKKISLADVYFQKFMEESSDSEKLLEMKEKARSYLSNIKNEIRY